MNDNSVELRVRLIAHTLLEYEFHEELFDELFYEKRVYRFPSDGQLVALTAIRTCNSSIEPDKIALVEGAKYFGRPASDGGEGSDADRLFRTIVSSGHTSTLEHLSFTFAVAGLSRAALGQLTRHRHFSFSVQSQRYVKFGSSDKSGGFKYVVPPRVIESEETYYKYDHVMAVLQDAYDRLRELGIPAEDARFVLPHATAFNLVVTANLRALLEFYAKRRRGSGAQWEIVELAEAMRREVVRVEPWTDPFFEQAKIEKGVS